MKKLFCAIVPVVILLSCSACFFSDREEKKPLHNSDINKETPAPVLPQDAEKSISASDDSIEPKFVMDGGGNFMAGVHFPAGEYLLLSAGEYKPLAYYQITKHNENHENIYGSALDEEYISLEDGDILFFIFGELYSLNG